MEQGLKEAVFLHTIHCAGSTHLNDPILFIIII
jgi:hypothetical protein